MKKLLAFLLAAMLLWLCGCVDGTDTENALSTPNFQSVAAGSDNELLTNAKWVGNDDSCENRITFKKDRFFSNSCACGSPVGSGDVTEIYSYNDKEKTVELYDCDGELLETAKILFLDELYLVIDIWDSVYVYENQNGYIPAVHEEVRDEVLGEITKPCFSVLEYKDNKLLVSSYDYDGDTPDLFEKWELGAEDDISFKTVTVVDDNGSVSVERAVLNAEDYQYIGEYYTCGYFEFDQNGNVTAITFYGDTVIQG